MKTKSRSAGSRGPDLDGPVREGHTVEFVNADEDEDGQQAGEQQRAALDNGQNQDRQKNER